MHKKILYLSVCMLLGLAACTGHNDISLVKDGLLDLDKSLTVGKAIDNYSYFKSTKWKLLTTENGRKVVQVTGNFNVTKHPSFNVANGTKEAYVQFQFQLNQDSTFEVAWCGIGGERIDGTVIEPDKNIAIGNCLNSLRSIYKNDPSI